MEKGHQVPKLKIEAMIDIPMLGMPLPRSLVAIVGGAAIGLIFLWGQGMPLPSLLGVFIPLLLGGLIHYLFQPEGLTLNEWIPILWEYVWLPQHAVWEPSAAVKKQEPSIRDRGARPDDLWRKDA